MTPTAPLWTRYRLSGDHLLSAEMFAKAADAVEKRATQATWPTFKVEHFAMVSSSVLLCVAFLESAANEIFADAMAPIPFGLPYADQSLIQRMKQLWEIPRTARYPVLDKYKVALAVANRSAMPTGSEPYQSAAIMISLRNALVHYEAEWNEIPFDGTGYSFEHKMSKALKGRFKLLRFAESRDPLYPGRCFSADCARWAVASTVAFSEDFLNRFGAFQPYTAVSSSLGKAIDSSKRRSIRPMSLWSRHVGVAGTRPFPRRKGVAGGMSTKDSL